MSSKIAQAEAALKRRQAAKFCFLLGERVFKYSWGQKRLRANLSRLIVDKSAFCKPRVFRVSKQKSARPGPRQGSRGLVGQRTTPSRTFTWRN